MILNCHKVNLAFVRTLLNLLFFGILFVLGCNKNSNASKDIVVFGKHIPVTITNEDLAKPDSRSGNIVRLLGRIRYAVIQNATQNIPTPTPQEIELWSLGMLQSLAAPKESLKKDVQDQKDIICYLIQRDYPSSTASTTCPSSTTQKNITGRFSKEFLDVFGKAYPTLASRKKRLKELETEPSYVAFWGNQASEQLRITTFIENKYGKEKVQVSDREVRNFIRLQKARHLPFEDKKAAAVFLKATKGLDAFNEYLLAEMEEGKDIVIPNPTLRKLLLETQSRRVNERFRK